MARVFGEESGLRNRKTSTTLLEGQNQYLRAVIGDLHDQIGALIGTNNALRSENKDKQVNIELLNAEINSLRSLMSQLVVEMKRGKGNLPKEETGKENRGLLSGNEHTDRENRRGDRQFTNKILAENQVVGNNRGIGSF